MAFNDEFIPELWAGKILDNFPANFAFNNMVNRDYEGEISGFGNTVNIAQFGPVTTKPYTSGATLAAPEQVKVQKTQLKIDQQDYFNVMCDDVKKVQSKLNLLDGATKEASIAFAKKTNEYVSGIMAAAGKAVAGTKTEPVHVTRDNIGQLLTDAMVYLDENDIPLEDRRIVIPPVMQGLLLNSPAFTISTDATDKRVASGKVYEGYGFKIEVANNLPTFKHHTSHTGFQVIATHPSCTTYAEQILEVESDRPYNMFSDIVKGLHVYGGLVTRPQGVAVLNLTVDPNEAA